MDLKRPHLLVGISHEPLFCVLESHFTTKALKIFMSLLREKILVLLRAKVRAEPLLNWVINVLIPSSSSREFRSNLMTEFLFSNIKSLRVLTMTHLLKLA